MVAQMTFTNQHSMPMKRIGTCARCKKPLTDPKSIEAGMGAICRGHKNQGDRMSDTANRTEFADKFYELISFSEAFTMHRNIDGSDHTVVVTNVPHLVVHHSPDGFEFGYGGSGAADLALNACQLYLNIIQYSGTKTKCFDGNCWKLAWFLHQEFKREFIQGVNWRKGATIPFEKMDRWFQTNMTGELLRECQLEPAGLNEFD